jgi:hypothetical protein
MAGLDKRAGRRPAAVCGNTDGSGEADERGKSHVRNACSG